MDQDLWRGDAIDLAAAIRTRKVSSREAVQAALARLDAVNPQLNAVTVLLADQALAAADRADAAVRGGTPLGALHGVPVTIKENIDQIDCATANGVPAFKDVIATSDSPPVASWKRAGAVIIGRTNTPAFSVRWHTDNELRGRTYNPWARAVTPGGSSGGAAAALAAGIGALAHGNDLGGSIRYPAYCCGVAGIRPTLGRVPSYNQTTTDERPLGHQLMAVNGPLARRVRDVRLGLAAMAARDPRDPWWVPAPLEGVPAERPIRVALVVDPAGQGVHPEVAGAVRAAGHALAGAGYAVEEIDPPAVEAVVATWAAIIVNELRHVSLPYIRKHGGADVNRCIDLTLAQVPDVGLEAYMRALAERARHVRDWMLFLERYPLVVGPVSTEPPFPVGFDVETREATARVLTAQRLLVAVNLLGLPAVAVPTGLGGDVPVGVQVIGSRYREDLGLDAAEVIEAQHGRLTPIDPVR
ncbi:MAG: amidase [Candidatus Rokuibacteriota bacterium]